MKNFEVVRCWMNRNGDVTSRDEGVQMEAVDADEAAEMFMEDLFNMDPEVQECVVEINGKLFDCSVESMPVFRAKER